VIRLPSSEMESAITFAVMVKCCTGLRELRCGQGAEEEREIR
jgi:hypothetical protein